MASVSLILIIVAPFAAIWVNGQSDQEYARFTSRIDTIPQDLVALRLNHERRLSSVDAASLKEAARQHYQGLLQARASFDEEYALSPREKALLRMRVLSASENPIDQVLTEVARKAAPKLSKITVERVGALRRLDIQFPMSSMTDGEVGQATKHKTVDSLKEEVLELVSRVTFDIFQYCRDMDLDSISVGCQHGVGIIVDGETIVTNRTLYEIQVGRDALQHLRSVPFVHEYSTSKHFQVDVDQFDRLQIETFGPWQR